jgi:hypothetical protein
MRFLAAFTHDDETAGPGSTTRPRRSGSNDRGWGGKGVREKVPGIIPAGQIVITRARRELHVAGSAEVIEAALGRHAGRWSGFGWRLGSEIVI